MISAYRAALEVDMDDALGDMLADLMHLCDRCPELGVFQTVLDRARSHYADEILTG